MTDWGRKPHPTPQVLFKRCKVKYRRCVSLFLFIIMFTLFCPTFCSTGGNLPLLQQKKGVILKAFLHDGGCISLECRMLMQNQVYFYKMHFFLNSEYSKWNALFQHFYLIWLLNQSGMLLCSVNTLYKAIASSWNQQLRFLCTSSITHSLQTVYIYNPSNTHVRTHTHTRTHARTLTRTHICTLKPFSCG